MEAMNEILPETQPYQAERPKVLIVDDEPGILDSLSCVLQAESDLFEVLTAPSAEAAMELLQTNNICLLVTDLRLPRMNGIELTALARSTSPTMRSILMTAFGNQFVMSDALKKGCYSYIEKPFDVDRMLKVVRQAMHLEDPAVVEPQKKPAAGMFATTESGVNVPLPHGSFAEELSGLAPKPPRAEKPSEQQNNFRRYLGTQLGDAVKKEFFRHAPQQKANPASVSSLPSPQAVSPRIDVAALLQSGTTHFGSAQYQQARDCWQAALKLDPECSEAKARLILLERIIRSKKNIFGAP